MTLAWTTEQKQIAKNKGKALVKLQVQLKHCKDGGNYDIAGPFSYDNALAMFLTAKLEDGDPKVATILQILRAEL